MMPSGMGGRSEISLPGLWGGCGSSEAVAVVRRLAARLDPTAGLFRLVAVEGLEGDGTATRWEAHFDLPGRQATLEVVVAFRWSEEESSYGEGLAVMREVPFPPPGSELAAMGERKELSRRRIRGIWRQQLRERRYLPEVIPALADVVAVAVDTGPLRRAEAVVLRTEGPVWRVQGRRRRLVRFAELISH